LDGLVVSLFGFGLGDPPDYGGLACPGISWFSAVAGTVLATQIVAASGEVPTTLEATRCIDVLTVP
jgi:hypothetical protein